jgi:hypothetical protein
MDESSKTHFKGDMERFKRQKKRCSLNLILSDLPPVNVTYGRELPMRHFKARFEFRK